MVSCIGSIGIGVRVKGLQGISYWFHCIGIRVIGVSISVQCIWYLFYWYWGHGWRYLVIVEWFVCRWLFYVARLRYSICLLHTFSIVLGGFQYIFCVRTLGFTNWSVISKTCIVRSQTVPWSMWTAIAASPSISTWCQSVTKESWDECVMEYSLLCRYSFTQHLKYTQDTIIHYHRAKDKQ